MKKLLLSLTVLTVVALVGAEALRADTEGSAEANVYVFVDPNVTVGANTPIVSAGTVQTGDFTAVINFRIDANQQEVCIYVEASPLFKGDVPTDPEVAPIPLNLSAGVDIEPSDATPLDSAEDTNAIYIGAGDPIMDFPTQRTETICFTSKQNGHFSQDVMVTVTWNQDDPEKPTGKYSGKVRLCALLQPVTTP